MNMFQTFLASIPSNRSEIVNDLEIPEIPLTPYIWEPDSISISDSSLETVTSIGEEYEAGSLSTDSSVPLSRAMTGSEFDYDWYRRYKRLDLSDPWEQMRIGWAAFPPEHIATLNSLSLQSTTDTTDTPPPSISYDPFPSQEFLRKIDQFLEDECCAFGPDDPAILALEEALKDVDLENLYSYQDVIL
ncbi:uncharacterized protein LOC133524620 [Cydia pomonella]|uniref:uncharacterized protein LOC133524620 n=1 Tax=Cydia pomonella TaxID=82600 RepID=UPI002ADE5E54|nr:uncharacterized protein LOC133524620 [Cydia pomonella]